MHKSFNFHDSMIITTVNLVIFAGGKFRENYGKTFHVGLSFMIILLFLIKSYGFIFAQGNFREESNIMKNVKVTLTQKFLCVQ